MRSSASMLPCGSNCRSSHGAGCAAATAAAAERVAEAAAAAAQGCRELQRRGAVAPVRPQLRNHVEDLWWRPIWAAEGPCGLPLPCHVPRDLCVRVVLVRPDPRLRPRPPQPLPEAERPAVPGHGSRGASSKAALDLIRPRTWRRAAALAVFRLVRLGWGLRIHKCGIQAKLFAWVPLVQEAHLVVGQDVLVPRLVQVLVQALDVAFEAVAPASGAELPEVDLV
mmetsp:Transcript_138157/g.350153  ORF Transcript_138157/g.350153 Transcript_138157/m.350153 type:complete len:224 (+) Transcript_138157:1475-2146(+)